MQHKSSAFVTLTYDDQNIPFVSNDVPIPTLCPRDVQLFQKRLLKRASQSFGWRQRFFLVGEYGDRTWRPHYHAAFFGFPVCPRGYTARSLTGRFLWQECCDVCRLVGEEWGLGDIGVGALDENRARYLGGYVTKKLTKKEDPRLEGRFPEFSRQSRGGAVKGSTGIGAPAVTQMAAIFEKHLDAKEVDVCGYITGAQGRKRPLGRYLRKKFRERVGTTEEVKDRATLEAWGEQMFPLLEAAKTDVEAVTLRAQVIKNSMAADASLKFQEELYRQRKGRFGL